MKLHSIYFLMIVAIGNIGTNVWANPTVVASCLGRAVGGENYRIKISANGKEEVLKAYYREDCDRVTNKINSNSTYPMTACACKWQSFLNLGNRLNCFKVKTNGSFEQIVNDLKFADMTDCQREAERLDSF